MLPHMKSRIALAVLLCTAAALEAGDWPQWRGPNRDGHTAPGSPEISSLPKDLKPSWKLAIGPGFSSPIVAAGKVIFLDERDGKEVAHCVDAATGKENWSASFADAFGDEWGSGPRSTPFVDGDRVYAQSIGGEFHCLDFATGKSLWHISFNTYGVSFSTKAAEGTASRRGNNGSGVVEGGQVYVPIGAKGASIVCFDKLTGKEIWKTGNDEAAYSSFLVVTLAGVKQLVAFTADALTGLDLKTGAQLWRLPFRTNAKRHAASPVLIGDDTLTVNSHTFGLIATKILKDGSAFKASPRWTNSQAKINLATPTLVDGFLYSQGGLNTKTLICVDASNGKLKWAQPGFGKDVKDYSSVIAVGKNLLVLTYDGQLLLLSANPEKYTELGRLQVCGNTWSHPAFADGKLYVRDMRELQCFDLSAKAVAQR